MRCHKKKKRSSNECQSIYVLQYLLSRRCAILGICWSARHFSINGAAAGAKGGALKLKGRREEERGVCFIRGRRLGSVPEIKQALLQLDPSHTPRSPTRPSRDAIPCSLAPCPRHLLTSVPAGHETQLDSFPPLPRPSVDMIPAGNRDSYSSTPFLQPVQSGSRREVLFFISAVSSPPSLYYSFQICRKLSYGHAAIRKAGWYLRGDLEIKVKN